MSVDSLDPKNLVLFLDDRPGEYLAILETEGIETLWEPRPDRFREVARSRRPGVVILGIDTWNSASVELLATLRSDGSPPLFVLGRSLDEREIVAALEAGVGECIDRSTVSPRLFLARVRNVLGRGSRDGHWPEDNGFEASRVQVGSLRVDVANRIVTVDDREIPLTDSELDLLTLLVRRPGRVFTRDQISVALRGMPYNGLDRSIDLKISRLRRKIGDNARYPRRIKSVRGRGYVLVGG